LAHGEEHRERAYYFGIQDGASWNLGLEEEVDPFNTDFFEGKRQPMKDIPTKSRFIAKGDRLWDLTHSLRKAIPDAKGIDSAIYNARTGRLIVKGDEVVHTRVDFLSQSEARRMSKYVRFTAQVYRVPSKGLNLREQGRIKLAENAESVAELSAIAQTGQEMEVEVNGGSLKLHLNVTGWMADECLSVYLGLNGKIGANTFDFGSSILVSNECPIVISLGGLGGGNEWMLRVLPEYFFIDGVRWSDRILDARGPLPGPTDRYQGAGAKNDWKIDSNTGKSLRICRVPFDFLSFLHFAPGLPDGSSPFLVLKSWSPTILMNLQDRVFDCRKILEEQGITFGVDDYACMVEGTSVIYLKLDHSQTILFDRILKASELESPRMIVGNFALLEGKKEIKLPDLNRADVRRLAKAGLVCRPGHIERLKLGHGADNLSIEVEPQIGTKNNVVDMRSKVVLTRNDTEGYRWEAGTFTLSGEPQIVQSHKIEGKWYALVVDARILTASEWLLSE